MAQKKDKKRLSGRFAIFITVLLLICTVVFLNNRLAQGSIKRFAYWIFSGIRGDATETSVSFDANDYNRFTLISGNLCIVSPDSISSYSLSGKSSMNAPVLLRNPAISPSASRFLAYDLGGLNFYVANNKKILFEASSDSKIISANMNSSGDFSIVTDSADSKSLLTIYDSSFKPVYKFHSSERYIFDASVSPNGKSAAVVTYGTEDGQFKSFLSLCRTNSEGFYVTQPLGTSVPLRVSYHSDRRILVICDDRTILFDNSGSVVAEVSHNNLPVKAFAESYGKHTAILLDNYGNGGNTRVIFVKDNGEISSPLDFDEDIYSISSAGNFTSLQFSDKCVVYKNDLTKLSEFKITADISRCMVNTDGSVISISDNFATLYIE